MLPEGEPHHALNDMAYTQLYYHIVFATKARKEAIVEDHERDLYMYLYGYCKNHNVKVLRIGGYVDHVHMFLQLPPTIAISDYMHDMKISASNFMKQHADKFPAFDGWASGYCALTYCQRDKDMIVGYIMKQKEHHKQTSLHDELKAMLDEAGVEYDERWLP